MDNPEIVIRKYEQSDEEYIIELWHSCKLVAPQNDPRSDITRKLQFQGELFLVGLFDDQNRCFNNGRI